MELRVVFVFLLSVIACSHYLVFLADGRQIKSTDDDSKRSSKTEKSAMHEKGQEPAAVKGYGRPSDAGHRPVSGRKQVLPPSVNGYKDGFRPTTPGSSPGVGHSFEEYDEETEQKPAGSTVRSIKGKHLSIDGYKEGFRPTTPGNSPGVGHSFEEDDEEIEKKPAGRISSINDKHFNVAGHRPGIGHASEPNA